jgi:hypothetical protein
VKVIIAGSRGYTNKAMVNLFLLQFIGEHGLPTEIVSGGARGVDKIGEELAKEHGIPVKIFSANWDFYGKSAGRRRNKEMAEYADALIAVWDSKSPGTKNMISEAKKKSLVVCVHLAV